MACNQLGQATGKPGRYYYAAYSGACPRRYMPKFLQLSLLVMLILGSGSTLISGVFDWPALPETGFLTGRAATTEDVDSGIAVFALKIDDKYVGEPLDIDIPQYAFHIDEESGVETPVIIIQAETNGAVSALGYKSLGGTETGVGLLKEFHLLGLEPPQ